MQDCITCEFAKRDRHNRYLDRCSGYGNCAYSEFKGVVKPTIIEFIEGHIARMEDKMDKAMYEIQDPQLVEFYRGRLTAFETVKQYIESDNN